LRFEASPDKEFPRLHLQNYQNKIGWRCGSGSRVPALQAQSAQFKPKSYQKKNLMHFLIFKMQTFSRKKSNWTHKFLENKLSNSFQNLDFISILPPFSRSNQLQEF
jgi:hypothetical protein